MQCKLFGGFSIPLEFSNYRRGRFASSVAQVDILHEDKKRSDKLHNIKGKSIVITDYEFVKDAPECCNYMQILRAAAGVLDSWHKITKPGDCVIWFCGLRRVRLIHGIK